MEFDISTKFNMSIKNKVNDLREIDTVGWYRYKPALHIYEKIGNVTSYAYYSNGKLFINSQSKNDNDIKITPIGKMISNKVTNVSDDQIHLTGYMNNSEIIDMFDPFNKGNIYLAIPYDVSIGSVCPNLSIKWMCSANDNNFAIYQISYS